MAASSPTRAACGCRHPVDLERQGDVPRHGAPGQQPGLLECDPVFLIAACAVGALTEDLDRSGARRVEVGDEAQEGGFAAAGGSDQRDELTRGHLEVHVLERAHLTRAAGEHLARPAHAHRADGGLTGRRGHRSASPRR
jgi:hypothetical protein